MSLFSLGLLFILLGVILVAIRKVAGGPDILERLGWVFILIGAIMYGTTILRGTEGPLLRN